MKVKIGNYQIFMKLPLHTSLMKIALIGQFLIKFFITLSVIIFVSLA